MVGIDKILDMYKKGGMWKEVKTKELVSHVLITLSRAESERDGRNYASPTLVVERLKATFNLSF